MFPFDILEQAFQGNSVAWDAIIFGILFVAMFSFNIFLWWKMPQLAKSQFVNNTIGGQKPTVVQCYDNKRVKFFNPAILRNGFGVLKNALYVFPKAWAGLEDLTPSERDIFNAVYTMDGTQSSFFLNYAIHSAILNPGVVAMIENERLMRKLKPNEPVSVDRNDLIEVLQAMPETEKVQVAPLYFSFPISDIRNLKTWVSKALSKSNFAELEYKIRQDERGNKEGFNHQTLLLLLVLISLILNGVTLAKTMGLI